MSPALGGSRLPDTCLLWGRWVGLGQGPHTTQLFPPGMEFADRLEVPFGLSSVPTPSIPSTVSSTWPSVALGHPAPALVHLDTTTGTEGLPRRAPLPSLSTHLGARAAGSPTPAPLPPSVLQPCPVPTCHTAQCVVRSASPDSPRAFSWEGQSWWADSPAGSGQVVSPRLPPGPACKDGTVHSLGTLSDPWWSSSRVTRRRPGPYGTAGHFLFSRLAGQAQDSG